MNTIFINKWINSSVLKNTFYINMFKYRYLLCYWYMITILIFLIKKIDYVVGDIFWEWKKLREEEIKRKWGGGKKEEQEGRWGVIWRREEER
jgi:hypothetical protein